MSALHFVSHRRSGGADAMANVLARRLPGPGRVVALSDLRPTGSGPARLLALPVLLVRLVRLLRRERPAAVMTHAAARGPARVVGGPGRRGAAAPRRPSASSDQLSAAALRLDGLFGRVGIFTDVIFVGEAVRASFPQRDVGRAAVRVIRNGVDLPTAPRIPRQRHDLGGLTVVSVGALEPRKNLTTLVRACAASGVVTSLVVLGEGPERAGLADLAARHGLDLRLLGQVPREQVLDELVGADVFAFPSRSEALPLSVVEAAALLRSAGRREQDRSQPRGARGRRDLLRPGGGGRVGHALRRLRHDPDLGRRLSEQALARSGSSASTRCWTLPAALRDAGDGPVTAVEAATRGRSAASTAVSRALRIGPGVVDAGTASAGAWC